MHLEHVAGGPGSGVTIATSRRASRLTKLDLPAFGGPTTATVRPARSRSPRCPSTKCAAISADSRRRPAGSPPAGPRARPPRAQNRSRLDPAQRPQQRLPPAFIEPAQRAIELAQRLAGLRPRLGIDEIGQTFDGGQIEPPVEECPARELARLSRPQTGRPDSASSSAAMTARPPCTCSSSTSSPVKLAGAGNHRTRASSIASPVCGSRMRRRPGAAPAADVPSDVGRRQPPPHPRCARAPVRPAPVPSRAQRSSRIRRTSSLPADDEEASRCGRLPACEKRVPRRGLVRAIGIYIEAMQLAHPA